MAYWRHKPNEMKIPQRREAGIKQKATIHCARIVRLQKEEDGWIMEKVRMVQISDQRL